MAITQERMIALITAARQCKDCALTYQRLISYEIKNLSPNPTREELLTFVQMVQTLSLTTSIPMEAAEILAREEEHFRLMATKNRRSAEYAKRKRATGTTYLSTPEMVGLKSPTAPLTLDRLKFTSLQSITQPHPTHPNQPAKPITNWGPEDDIIQHKIRINAEHKKVKMAEPYPDVYDSSQPLRPDDCRAIGIPVLDDEDGLF